MSNTITNNNTSSTSSSTPTSALGQSTLNMQEFLQLMTTQLENQDPLNPMSDSDFFGQMAQLGTVEGMDELNNSAQVQQAQSLMGQTVTATNPNAATTGGGATVTGVVQSLSIQSGVYYLGIQSPNGSVTSVPISSLQSVQSTPNLSGDSSLVGQTVTGVASVNGTNTTLSGTVTGVGLTNGVPTVTVQVSKTQTVTMNVNTLTSLSG